MSLKYAVQYTVNGELFTNTADHPSCFGYFTSLTQAIPRGAEVKPVVYLSTMMPEAEFRKFFGQIVKAMPTMTINGNVVKAPTVGYFGARSKRFGNIGNNFGNDAYLRIKLPKGIKWGEVYPILKFYFKHVTRPGRPDGPSVGEYERTGQTVIAELGKGSILHIMAAMGLTKGLIGYTYPLPRGPIFKKAAQDFFNGKINVEFNPHFEMRWERPVVTMDYTETYAGPKLHSRQCVNVSYIPGMTKLTESNASSEQLTKALADGSMISFGSYGDATSQSYNLEDFKQVLRRVIKTME